MRKIRAPFVWKASRGGTRRPGTHPPKKWHKGVPYSICGLGSPVPSSQGLIGTLGGLDGRYMPDDTAAQNVSHASRRRMCGNAFPVGWIGVSISCWYSLWFRELLGTRRDKTMSNLLAGVRRQPYTKTNHRSTGQTTTKPLLSRIRSAVE